MNDETQVSGQTSIPIPEQPKQELHPNLNAGNPAPEGNQRALKYKTPEARVGLLEAYCLHVEQGYSDDSFPDVDMQTLKRYLTDFASDFDIELMEKVDVARRKRRLHWERVGMNGTSGIPISYKTSRGEIKDAPGRFNDKSWKFIMSNMFNWRDRTDVTSGDEKIKGPTIFIPKELDE